jgi:hypothetical protein
LSGNTAKSALVIEKNKIESRNGPKINDISRFFENKQLISRDKERGKNGGISGITKLTNFKTTNI